MSTIKVNSIKNTSTNSGGITIDSNGAAVISTIKVDTIQNSSTSTGGITIDSNGAAVVSAVKVDTIKNTSTSTGGIAIESNGSAKFDGRAYGLERTITASSFDLTEGNFWTCGAIAIPNPTNGVAGQSGLIIVTAAPTSFGSNWDFPGGAYTAPTTFPAVAPFYIKSSTVFYLGNWTEGIA